uniref:Uncharacterized protein n=1 Tax=Glossina pallidipes TaxID=7398 RepID=A0A1A9ZW75_GLOPL
MNKKKKNGSAQTAKQSSDFQLFRYAKVVKRSLIFLAVILASLFPINIPFCAAIYGGEKNLECCLQRVASVTVSIQVVAEAPKVLYTNYNSTPLMNEGKEKVTVLRLIYRTGEQKYCNANVKMLILSLVI